jgi:nitrite reductase/ring-hydroxylating ferredoxin subunit
MAKLIKITEVSDITEGKIKEFKIDGMTIAVTKVGNEYSAFEAYCTHAQCALTGGFFDGKVITCYCHGAQFDLKTGKVLSPPATVPLKIYPVKKEKGSIFIEI